MRMYGYGEDSLTLWALANRLALILTELGDESDPADCQVFYRPSFGRRGGDNRSEFGEFDFIILAREHVYLGESKWDRSSQKGKDAVLDLPSEQLHRHEVFRFYFEQWAYGSYRTWEEFLERAHPPMTKRLARGTTRLASNLQTVFRVIKDHYTSRPEVKDVLLYLYDGDNEQPIPQQAREDFNLVRIDYSGALLGNFISIEM